LTSFRTSLIALPERNDFETFRISRNAKSPPLSKPRSNRSQLQLDVSHHSIQ
jgi:hypothetical protein